MTVKVVTDSVADLPADVVKDLGITVIPLLVRFGEEVYRDGVDLTTEQFYDKLKQGKILPARLTGATPQEQRKIRGAIRRARVMGLLR